MNIRSTLLDDLRALFIASLYVIGIALSWAIILFVGSFIFGWILPDATFSQVVVWTVAMITLIWMTTLAFFCRNASSKRHSTGNDLVVIGGVIAFHNYSDDSDLVVVGEVVRITKGLICPQDISVELMTLDQVSPDYIRVRRIQGRWYVSADDRPICGPVEHVQPYSIT